VEATPGRQVRAAPGSPLTVLELGTVEYRDAWEVQRTLVDARSHERVGDTLVLLEHPPVYTLGRRADAANVLLDATALAAAGIDVVEVDRGGDVTYHGPGQLVAYPIVRLAGARHVVDFVRTLETVAIEALATLGVDAHPREGLTGVWVGRDKLVAIGVRVGAGGITSHGLALNVDPDLTHFAGIVPCGITTEGVGSLASLGHPTTMPAARAALRAAFARTFDTALVDAPDDLVPSLPSAPPTAGSR
jgi:lipoyl(octanoyl) transferase